MIITVSGRAGAGKSTLAKALAHRLRLKRYSSGDLQREIAREKGISFQTVLLLTIRGVMIAETPRIRRIFAILLPTTFPMAISDDPSRTEKILTISSGAEVPNATTVSPITMGVIPNFLAREDAPRTRVSAPAIKITKPIIRKIMIYSIETSIITHSLYSARDH